MHRFSVQKTLLEDLGVWFVHASRRQMRISCHDHAGANRGEKAQEAVEIKHTSRAKRWLVTEITGRKTSGTDEKGLFFMEKSAAGTRCMVGIRILYCCMDVNIWMLHLVIMWFCLNAPCNVHVAHSHLYWIKGASSSLQVARSPEVVLFHIQNKIETCHSKQQTLQCTGLKTKQTKKNINIG